MTDDARGVQSVFREANERLRSRFQELTHHGRRPVICECGDTSCMEVLELSEAEYDRVREGGYFILAPGHDDPHVERIVERRHGFVVAEKN
jgi:hypothetical protein